MTNTRLINIAQMLINGLKSKSTPKTFFIFKVEEAHQLIRCLNLFYTSKKTLNISVWNESHPYTIAIQVQDNVLFSNTRPFINLLPSQKYMLNELLHLDNNLNPIDQVYRDLMAVNFI